MTQPGNYPDTNLKASAQAAATLTGRYVCLILRKDGDDELIRRIIDGGVRLKYANNVGKLAPWVGLARQKASVAKPKPSTPSTA